MTVVNLNQVLGRGWGGMLTIGVLFSFAAAHKLADELMSPGYYYDNKWLIVVIGGLGILLTAGLGAIINRERIAYDPNTRQKTVVRNWHTVLAIPIQYWSVVVAFMMFIDLGHTR
jgi:hypothetical protein